MSWRTEGNSPPTQRQRRRAAAMRGALTDAERRLWWHLRYRLPSPGTHCRRPVPLGPYFADFCWLSARLVVGVDGNQHGFDRQALDDAKRTAYLNEQGFRVLRFSNLEVMTSIDVVLDTIFAALGSAAPTPVRACGPTRPSAQEGGHL